MFVSIPPYLHIWCFTGLLIPCLSAYFTTYQLNSCLFLLCVPQHFHLSELVEAHLLITVCSGILHFICNTSITSASLWYTAHVLHSWWPYVFLALVKMPWMDGIFWNLKLSWHQHGLVRLRNLVLLRYVVHHVDMYSIERCILYA